VLLFPTEAPVFLGDVSPGSEGAPLHGTRSAFAKVCTAVALCAAVVCNADVVCASVVCAVVRVDEGVFCYKTDCVLCVRVPAEDDRIV
jgi:hypothetical protein